MVGSVGVVEGCGGWTRERSERLSKELVGRRWLGWSVGTRRCARVRVVRAGARMSAVAGVWSVGWL